MIRTAPSEPGSASILGLEASVGTTTLTNRSTQRPVALQGTPAALHSIASVTASAQVKFTE